jgi:hypothetical protein
MIRHRPVTLTLIGACSCLIVWNVDGQGRNSRRPIWEYKVESEFSLVVDEVIYGTKNPVAKTDEDSKLGASLNRLGAQGWELITVEHDKTGIGPAMITT